LWKTVNEKDFERATPGNWIINASIIDLKNTHKIIIGTEREGVQVSNDGGATFTASNAGFHHQHISDVAMDREHPERALVVLAFDNDAFLATKDGGDTWTTLGPGLMRTELRHVYAAPTGWWASLTNGVWSKYDEITHKWVRAGLFVPDQVAASAAKATAKSQNGAVAANPAAPKKPVPALSAYLVNEMAFRSDTWYAATAGGLLLSKDRGATWKSAGKESTGDIPLSSAAIAVQPPNVTFRRDSNGRIYYVLSDAQSGREIEELPPEVVRYVAQGIEDYLKQEQAKHTPLNTKG